MMFALGMFAFSADTAPMHELRRRTSWRHPTNPRVGRRPAGQFAGPGDDVVTITGIVADGQLGKRQALRDLREMADTGAAWSLIDGAGEVYGAFVIEDLDETGRHMIAEGVPRISDFTLSLRRMDDDAEPETEAV